MPPRGGSRALRQPDGVGGRNAHPLSTAVLLRCRVPPRQIMGGARGPYCRDIIYTGFGVRAPSHSIWDIGITW